MPFCASLGYFIQMLLKHRHIQPSRVAKITIMLSICLFLQRSIKKEDELYERVIKHIPIEQDPVFITGHWRSGTTYLHYLMSLDAENFAYPTNYQCFLPTIFLTKNENAWIYKFLNKTMGTRTRTIDNMEFALASPQEEEWMYIPLGAFSYIFEKLFFPVTATSDFDKIIELSNNDKTRSVTLQIFKKLTFVYHKRILSKSPGHFSRIPLLKQLFPQSKFIFIVRNPYDVVPSMIHAGSILGKILSLQKKSVDDALSVANFLQFYFDTMHHNMQRLKINDEYVILKYEDLIREPLRCIHNIYEMLNLKFNNKYENDLVNYLQSVRNYKRNQYNLLPEMKQVIYTKCHHIFDTYAYEK